MSKLFPFAASCLLALLPAPQAAASSPAAELTAEGREFYRRGQLESALQKFEEAIKAGAQGGELFYQTGYCYKAARRDLEASRRYMRMAVPPLEAEAAKERKRPAPFYYLAAIHTNELGDGVEGTEAAKRGVELAEKGAFGKSTDGETLFQVGRLYSLAGQEEKAIPWYEKAVPALESAAGVYRQYLLASVEQLSGYYVKKPEPARAATWLLRLLELEPTREKERLSAGLLLVKLGRHDDAIKTLRGFTDDDLATESNYIVKAVSRYKELGAPEAPPEWGKLDDAGIQDLAVKAASRLAEVRKKEEEEGAAADPSTSQPVRPPAPERLEAEKVFFGLLVELARRGHLLREFAFSRGFAVLIFR